MLSSSIVLALTTIQDAQNIVIKSSNSDDFSSCDDFDENEIRSVYEGGCNSPADNWQIRSAEPSFYLNSIAIFPVNACDTVYQSEF